MHVCRRLGHRAAQGFLRAVGTIAMSIPAKQCSRPSGNRKMHFVGPAKASLQAPRTRHRRKASSQQQEFSQTRFHPSFAYDRQETRKCIIRRLQNAFLQAPKDTHCSQNKCVYRGSQNALCHPARENCLRRQCSQNEKILGMRLRALLYIGSVGCREMPWSAQPHFVKSSQRTTMHFPAANAFGTCYSGYSTFV